MLRTLNAFLLSRHAYDERDGLRFVYWGASDEGPVRLVFTRREAVMFIERGTPSEGGRRQALELTNFAGKPVDGLYFRSRRALRWERSRIREAFGRTYEGDVKAHTRFLMERFVTGAARVRGEARARGGFVEFVDPHLKQSDYQPELSVLAFDIETDGFDGPILSIACAGAGGERAWVRRDSSGKGFTGVPDERALIHAFVEHVAQVDPDVLSGWNVVEFDLRVLERRAKELGVRLTLGRAGTRAKVLEPRSARQPAVAHLEGRVMLDGLATLRSATFSFESFRLEDVAQALLGRGKKIEHGGDPVAEIRRLFHEDPEALAAYNLEDCRLVLDVLKHADLVGFAVERQSLTGLPMGRQGGSVAAFDNLYLPRLHREGVVAPDVGDSDEVVTSPGGYVLDSQPGLYRNVLVLDFKSLYPSIIRTFAIDPLGLAFPGVDPIPGFEGGTFSRDRHLLPAILERLWSARDDAKKRGDAARSRVLKILMNSFYGVLGTPGCRFFSPKLASSITLRGHAILMDSRRFIEERGLSVIYGDTDSLFVWVGDDEPDASRVGRELAHALNGYWRERLDEELRIASHLEVEFETHYVRFLMPTMRGSEKGSKKRYAGLVLNGEGEAQVVVKGLEAARTDWTGLARRMQRQLLRRVFQDRPWRDWLRQLVSDVRAGRLDDELVYRRRLRRSLDDYTKNAPPHVQAARKLGRPVREIRYVMSSRGPEP
ncbi:MAG: DNA polymerase II, partial [Myxococcota bacterium]